MGFKLHKDGGCFELPGVFTRETQSSKTTMKVLLTLTVVLAALTGLAMAACPSSSAISPCTCRVETPGRTLDCASITSGQQLATLMTNDMGDPHFDFFQAIKASGSVALDSLPANSFADKTLTHIWIGDSSLASVDDAAFEGALGERLLEILMGATPSLTSFPFASLESLPMLFKLQITSSGLTSVTSFAAAPELSEIKLTNAAISSVAAGSFSGLPNLALVDLGSNPLGAVEAGSFEASTSQPWTLYLDNCGITTVAGTAFSGTLPVGVSLAGNELTTVDEAVFGPLVSSMVADEAAGGIVGGLYLGNNPITCDCGLAWAAADPSTLAMVKGVVCSGGDVAGTALEDLPGDFFASC